MKIFKQITVTVLALFLLCSCAPQSTDTGKTSVVTTLFPQYDFTREIAGDKADIKLLLPPGVEAHAYEPTAADIIKINSCDLFIYTGDDMEPWVKRLLSSGEIKGHILNLSADIVLDAEEDGHDHDVDPHIWTNPQNAITMVKSITSALCAASSENAEYFTKRSEGYITKLNQLDFDFQTTVSQAPQKEMVFGTKFALHYFAQRYGLSHKAAVDSCGEETEPSAKVMTQLINEIKEKKLTVVWYGELESTKTAEAIAAETGAVPTLFHSCHNLSKEDMEKGETYLSLMTQNLQALKRGLY